MSSSGPGGGTPLRAVDRVTGPPRPTRRGANAPPKGQLGLAVSGTRPDGYHEIRTVLASVDLWGHAFVYAGGPGRAPIATNPAFRPMAGIWS